MRKLMWAVSFAICGILASSGCAAQRFVSQTHWSNADTLYVAYDEVAGDSTSARIKKCNRAPDNRMECVDEMAVNAVLGK